MRRAKNRLLASAFVLASLCLLLILGCSLLERAGGAFRPWFSHRFHVEEKKLDCEDCHSGAKTEALAGMPLPDTCAPCHGEIDLKKPEERRATAFYPGGNLAWKNVTRLSPEVTFSHQIHAEKNVPCGDCHRGIEKSEHVDPSLNVGKWACMDCHARMNASNECSSCHQTIRREVAPESHRLNWEVRHGQRSQESKEWQRLCQLCHTKDSCAHCHNEVKPRNHTEFWRIQGHGAIGAIDRDKCRTCHQTDYCVQCHQETPPRSHLGAWGAPRDIHCLSCHTPLQSSENCVLCHRATPSHSEASPKPPDHNAAMNCRQCHGVGQSLPHVDNGSDCNSCHR
jgi:hypothetical protein